MNAMVSRFVLFTLLSVTSVAARAVDIAVTRPTDLRADRYADAASLKVLAAGTSVELLKTEAGWVQVRAGAQTGWVRATGLTGDAASVSALARIENGRSASGNIVVAAGIRGMPKASKHALIVGVDRVVASSLWSGVPDDVESARMIARRLDVPDDNIEVVKGPQATFDELGNAIARLNDRVRSGDQVFVYFSGPGTRATDEGGCVAAWMTADGRPLSAAATVQRMKPTFAAASKVFMVSDAGYAGPDGKFVASPPARGCTTGTGDLPLVDAASAAGVPVLNIAVLQSAAGSGQGVDLPRAGGLFTQALVDCLFGDAVDRDRSTSLSVAELAACIDLRGKQGRDGQRASAASTSGNTAYGVLTGIVASGPQPAPGTNAPRAAIDDVFAQRDGRIVVTMTATPSTLQIGRDYLDLSLTSTRAGFVYLVLLGSDGKGFYLLFPNDLDRDNRIEAGQSLRLPRPNWRVQAQGPAGRDTVLAIVAESERDLASFAAHKEGPFSMALSDAEGRAQLQWLLGRSGRAGAADCVDGGQRRNLAAVRVCSDAFGAAAVEIEEK